MGIISQLVDPDVKEIEEVYQIAENDADGSGESYEDGVLNTLRWLFEGASKPLQNL